MADKMSEVRTAITFLAEEFPATMPPDRVKELLGLKTSAATLGRKFRAHTKPTTDRNGNIVLPELVRTYYLNERGREIATYAYNPEYHQAQAEKAQAESTAEQIDRQYDEHRDGFLFPVNRGHNE